MSLLRQLWISVVVTIVIVLFGALTLSVVTARTYLQQELLTQGANGASSLALSISQLGTDRAMAETLVNATFDSGYYERITFRDPDGNQVVERVSDYVAVATPGWFRQLVPIAAPPGRAQVMSGWRQAGAVEVVAHTRYAYEALWSGAVRMAVMLLAAGFVWGGAITWLMKRIRRPLDDMAGQAEAIGEGRFMTVSEPRVSELRSVARALNRMAERVRRLFDDQAARIAELRETAIRDQVSGLPNRDHFMGELRQQLSDENAPETGALALLRLVDLERLNRRLGRARTDEAIRRFADTLTAAAGEGGCAARLNGSDFALLLPGATPNEAESAVAAAPGLALPDGDDPRETSAVARAITEFHRPEAPGAVMARIDTALMSAEQSGRLERVGDTAVVEPAGEFAWRGVIEQALAERRFRLAFFPLLSAEGALIHGEAMLRLVTPDGELLTAGQFMPAAQRVDLAAACDLMAVELALASLGDGERAIALNLSPHSLLAAGFLSRLHESLAAEGERARGLSFEVSERGLDAHLGGLEALGDLLARHGCRFGLEHFGQRLSALPRLYALRLGYLKIDGAFVAGIEGSAANRNLVQAIARTAQGLEIDAYAEQVHTAAEWESLAQLGVRGMTGPEATRRASPP